MSLSGTAKGRLGRRVQPVPTGWQHAPLGRRTAAAVLDLVLFVVTLGVGWCVWTYRLWGRGTTPGKALLGLTVLDTTTRQPCTRRRMARRGLVYRLAAVVLGIATAGFCYLYAVASALGPNRRTLYDDWAQTLVVTRG